MANPFTRDDTMLGICQAVGEDVGVNPLWLRIGFGVLLFWNIGAAVAAYLTLGVLVLAVRLVMPNRAARAEASVAVPANDADDARFDLAA